MHLLRALLAALLITGSLISVCDAQQRKPTPQSSPSPTSGEQLRLIEAERANQAAQTEYYIAQTAKLKERPEQKSFWVNVRENPASVLGALAALVAFISFFFNYRATLLAQENTQFYEAMKRFGDDKSAALRASSAAILAQMAGMRRLRFSLTRLLRMKRKDELDFLETARNQLTYGYLIEENYVAILSIRDALRHLLVVEPVETGERLVRINEWLHVELRNSLIDYFVSIGTTKLEDIGQEYRDKAAALGYAPEFIARFVNTNARIFDSAFVNKSFVFASMTDEKKAETLEATQNSLMKISFKFRMLMRLLQNAFKHRGIQDHFNGDLILTRGKFIECDLSDADLRRSYMGGANLRDADLTSALLQGAWLFGAQLDGTKMYGAQIDEETDLSESNWWKANFFDVQQKGVDRDLIRRLITAYGAPDIAVEPHPSVVSVLSEEKDNEDEDNSSSR